MAVSWTYDGGANLTAVCNGLTPVTSYDLYANDPNSSGDTQISDGSGNVTLNITDIGGLSAGDTVYAQVEHTTGDDNPVSAIIIKYGTASTTDQGIPATWSYDGGTGGTGTLSVTFTSANGITYGLNGQSGTPVTVAGDGGSKTLTITDLNPGTSTSFHGIIYEDGASPTLNYAIRLFTTGEAGSGFDGIGGTTPTGPEAFRVAIAFGDNTLASSPTWTYIDDNPNLVASWQAERGRRAEFDQTDTGTATVTINDPNGLLDPFNAAGPYFGMIEPRLPIKLARRHAITGDWYDRWRGFIDDLAYEEHPSQKTMQLVISCVGIFSVLSKMEMTPYPDWGDVNPNTGAGAPGTVFFEDGPANTRIEQILGNAGIPGDMAIVFTLNVDVQETTYSTGESAMTALQETIDAEFPGGVANQYEDRFGRYVAHGRFARFDPVTVAASASPGAWDYHEWKAGDGAAVAASPTDTAQIRAYSFNRGLDKIINAARFTYLNIPREDVDSMLVADGTSITTFGIGSLSADDLIIKGGKDIHVNDPAAECLDFANWFVTNYKAPQNRITKLQFKSLAPNDSRAGPLWDLLCLIDISDHVIVTVSHPASAGMVDDAYIIEGIRELQQPLGDPNYDYVELELDVSPVGAHFPRVTEGFSSAISSSGSGTRAIERSRSSPALVGAGGSGVSA